MEEDATVDLSASGGHDVQFGGRVVCPVQFLVRHYPIRSQAQGVTKVFYDRRPRFLDSERQLGWHIQYDALRPGDSLLRDPASLTKFNEAEELRRLRSIHRDTPTLEATRHRLEESARAIGRLNTESGRRTEELSRVTGELAVSHLNSLPSPLSSRVRARCSKMSAARRSSRRFEGPCCQS
jgi:hypothetical protein